MEGDLERVKGIEPSYSAWEAAALPLSYTRMADLPRGGRLPRAVARVKLSSGCHISHKC
jgi:hypothetical protein